MLMVGVIPFYLRRGHQSCFDSQLGLNMYFVPEYIEIILGLQIDDGVTGTPIPPNYFKQVMCQELGVGDEDNQILRFMSELTSVGCTRAIIESQEVNTEEEGVAGYSIINLHGDWFVTTGKNLNGMSGEDENFYPIPIGYELINIAKYLVRGPGDHLPHIYDADDGALQMVTMYSHA